jgi:hypothetical protein
MFWVAGWGSGWFGLNRKDSSVPIPKFVTPCGTLHTNFGIDQDTSKLMYLVWFSDLKFASELAANDVANFKSTTLGL